MAECVECRTASKMKMQDVKIIKKEPLYRGFIQLDKMLLHYRLFAGNWSPLVDRELIIRPPAVAVLLLDLTRQKIILIEQFRVGALKDPDSPWLLEIVAGIVPAETDLITQAKKEIQEEVGLEVKKLNFIMNYWASPGASNEEVYLYWANVDSTQAQGIHGAPDENEDIKIHVLDIEAALNLYRENKIKNGFAIIALQWLALNHANLT